MKKPRMSNKKYLCIFLPVVIFLAAFCIVCDVVMNLFSASLDTYLGMGERVVTGGGNYTEEDTDYYAQTYARSQEGKVASSEAAARVAERLGDEGEILLKNDGTLPLAENEKVTPFGFRYTTPVLTGTGSGAATVIQNFVVHPDDALNAYFDVNAAAEEKLNAASAVYATAEGYKSSADENGKFSGATASVGEFDPAVYVNYPVGDYKTGIVFLGRQGGEGGDFQMTPYYSDAGRTKIADHQLQLMPYEKQMLEAAKAACDKVVVILNSPNPIEMRDLENDAGVNAVLWVGTTGARGFESMGKILCGKVNPSGKTPDIWYEDFTADPTFVNYGDFTYSDGSTKFVEYEEGIYVGYKYYETAFEGDEYRNAVVYPFGYGLNYDDDKVTQTLTDVTLDEETGVVTVTGTIDNDSAAYDVKEVVQIYYDPPYDPTGSGIEKAKKNLVAFDKTEVAAGEHGVSFTVTFDLEDMASYDYKGYYTEGKGSYVLESGTYRIVLGKDSHDEWGSRDLTLNRTVVYYDEDGLTAAVNGCDYVGKRPSDEVLATNRYEYISDYMDGEGEFGASGACSTLTRADGFAPGTTAPAAKNVPAAAAEQVTRTKQGTFDYSAHWKALYGTDAPTANAQNGLTLSALRGLPYDDDMWELLLDQIDYSDPDLQYLIGYGAFRTNKLDAIGKSVTSESDGPQAIGKTGMSDGAGAACAYPAEVVIAATWNQALAEEMGRSIGEESLAQGANGWYGPACNIHRSPFLGRAYEYYSEDAVLSGYMTMRAVRGAASKGFTAYVKHFAVNDQDTNRTELCTWLTEQALRELYLKPFEISVKKGEVQDQYLRLVDEENEIYEVTAYTRKSTTGIMTSMNYIGGVWTSLDYTLCTEILRGEWGFRGSVITDSATPVNDQCNAALAAGNDYWLTFMKGSYIRNLEDPIVRWTVRTAVHDICYAVVNSNAMQGIGPSQAYYYTMSPWAIWLTVGNVVIWCLVLAFGILTALRFRDAKKHPEHYASAEKKKG